MLIGGLQFDAQEAFAGPGGRVLPDAEFAPIHRLAVGNIAIGAPLTGQQGQIYPEHRQGPGDRLARCEAMFQTCYASADYKEGIRAFRREAQTRSVTGK